MYKPLVEKRIPSTRVPGRWLKLNLWFASPANKRCQTAVQQNRTTSTYVQQSTCIMYGYNIGGARVPHKYPLLRYVRVVRLSWAGPQEHGTSYSSSSAHKEYRTSPIRHRHRKNTAKIAHIARRTTSHRTAKHWSGCQFACWSDQSPIGATGCLREKWLDSNELRFVSCVLFFLLKLVCKNDQRLKPS